MESFHAKLYKVLITEECKVCIANLTSSSSSFFSFSTSTLLLVPFTEKSST